MDIQKLHETATEIVAEGKGILAADESDGTIKKRFDSIGVESTEEARRAYRDLLFTTEGVEDYISGVILYDETIRQAAVDGTPFRNCSSRRASSPGSRSTRVRSRSRSPRARRSPKGSTDCAADSRSTANSAPASRSGAASSRSERESRASTASGRTRTRSRAMPRCHRKPGSSRSSSRKS
jgi:hypothetical protein